MTVKYVIRTRHVVETEFELDLTDVPDNDKFGTYAVFMAMLAGASVGSLTVIPEFKEQHILDAQADVKLIDTEHKDDADEEDPDDIPS